MTIARLVVRTVGAALAVIAVLMALDLFGIDIGPAVAGLGVVGIAVGLGAQTLIRDWLTGIFIVLENQFSRATSCASPASRASWRTSACDARPCAASTGRFTSCRTARSWSRPPDAPLGPDHLDLTVTPMPTATVSCG